MVEEDAVKEPPHPEDGPEMDGVGGTVGGRIGARPPPAHSASTQAARSSSVSSAASASLLFQQEPRGAVGEVPTGTCPASRLPWNRWNLLGKLSHRAESPGALGANENRDNEGLNATASTETSYHVVDDLTRAGREESPDLRNETSAPARYAADAGSEKAGRRRPRLALPTRLTTPTKSPSPHSLDGEESDGRRTRSRTRHGGPRKSTGDYASEVCIGPDYQATLPVVGSCCNPAGGRCGAGDVLWDPARFSRQSSASQERAASLIAQERYFAGRMLMMECLAANEYDAGAAQAEFDRRTASRSAKARAVDGTTSDDAADEPSARGPTRFPFLWSDDEEAVFKSMVESDGLNVSKLANFLGRPKVEILANYYCWRGRGGRVREQPIHADPDECCVCKLPGFLIVCDRCQNAFHLNCLDPPLEKKDIPEGNWYCHECASRLPVPQNPRNARVDAATRMRLLSSQKELAGRSRGMQPATNSNRAHRSGLEGKLRPCSSQRRSCSFGGEFGSRGSPTADSFESPQSPAASTRNDTDDLASSASDADALASDADASASDADAFNDSDSHHSPSSSVSSSPEKPVLERKRGRGSDSDESYRVSESDCGSDSDDDVVYVGTLTNRNLQVVRPTAVSGEQVRDRSTEYVVNVPFRSDGTLGLKLSWSRRKMRAIVVSSASNESGGLFLADNDAILKVDGKDTDMKDLKDVLEMCTQRAEGQQSKQFLMLHEHGLESNSHRSCQLTPSSTSPSISTGREPIAFVPVTSFTAPDPNVGHVAMSSREPPAGSAFDSVDPSLNDDVSSKTAEALGPLTLESAAHSQGRELPGAPDCESVPAKSSGLQYEVIDLTLDSPPSSPERY